MVQDRGIVTMADH